MAIETQTALNVAAVTFNSRPESQLQALAAHLCALIDFVREDETLISAPLTECEYQQLAARLDDLLDFVGADEGHILAPLVELVGTFIKNYEDEHVPELAALSIA